jgi:hypothetical protein
MLSGIEGVLGGHESVCGDSGSRMAVVSLGNPRDQQPSPIRDCRTRTALRWLVEGGRWFRNQALRERGEEEGTSKHPCSSAASRCDVRLFPIRGRRWVAPSSQLKLQHPTTCWPGILPCSLPSIGRVGVGGRSRIEFASSCADYGRS